MPDLTPLDSIRVFPLTSLACLLYVAQVIGTKVVWCILLLETSIYSLPRRIWELVNSSMSKLFFQWKMQSHVSPIWNKYPDESSASLNFWSLGKYAQMLLAGYMFYSSGEEFGAALSAPCSFHCRGNWSGLKGQGNVLDDSHKPRLCALLHRQSNINFPTRARVLYKEKRKCAHIPDWPLHIQAGMHMGHM